jgi:hypothetical protein
MTGMAASPYVKALDDIQKSLTGFLKPLGFQKKGRTYNRPVGDGLVQAVAGHFADVRRECGL